MKVKKKGLRVFLFMTLIVSVSNHLSVGQEVKGLFKQTSRSNHASLNTEGSGARDPTVIRSRDVEISLDILCEEESKETANSIVLNLFDDVLLIAIKENEERRSSTQYTWYGHITGIERSPVILVVNGENVAGNITVEGRMYQVRPVTRGVHSVREIDQSAFPRELPPLVPEVLRQLPIADPPLFQQSNEVTIDVLVVYTAEAANATWDIEAEIQLAVDETNGVYANSGVNQRIRLVHSAQVTYTETGDYELDLIRLYLQKDGFMDEVHGLRNAYYADVVSLWVATMHDACGVAIPLPVNTVFFAPFAFNVVDRDCATANYIFAHELGHNMGAHHDWYMEEIPLPYLYSHGYVDRAYRWRTVMAYADECEDHGTYCPVVPYFSNPDIEYEGTPLGVPEGSPLPADNRKSLNNTAATVAAFRVEGGLNPWGAAANAEASVHGPNTFTRSCAINQLAIILIPICLIILLGTRRSQKHKTHIPAINQKGRALFRSRSYSNVLRRG